MPANEVDDYLRRHPLDSEGLSSRRPVSPSRRVQPSERQRVPVHPLFSKDSAQTMNRYMVNNRPFESRDDYMIGGRFYTHGFDEWLPE